MVAADGTTGVFALLGVLLGGLMTAALAYLDDRRRRRRDLYVAAFRCLTRWRKIELARAGKVGSLRDEVVRLGRDLDQYMVTVPQARNSRERGEHLLIYKQMLEFFAGHDLEKELSPEKEKEITRVVGQLEQRIEAEFSRRSWLSRLVRRAPKTAEAIVQTRRNAGAT